MGRKRTGILAGALTLILLLAGGCGAQTETLRYALVTGQRGAKAEKALTQLESGMEDFAGAQGLKARTFASEKETVASYGDEISQAVQEELQNNPSIGMWWIKYLFMRSSFPQNV